MCDYFAFRDQARLTFPDLVVSVLMYEHGSGVGGEITMYRVKVNGLAIGAAAIIGEAPSAQEAIAAVVQQVTVARRAVRAQRLSWMVARNGGRQAGRPLRQAA